MTMTTTNRRAAPADRKPAREEQHFSFEIDGETYTFPVPVSKVTSPGFIRRNRHRDELDLGFTVFETLAGDTDEGKRCLEAIDDMSPAEFNTMVDDFWEFSDVPKGE